MQSFRHRASLLQSRFSPYRKIPTWGIQLEYYLPFPLSLVTIQAARAFFNGDNPKIKNCRIKLFMVEFDIDPPKWVHYNF